MGFARVGCLAKSLKGSKFDRAIISPMKMAALLSMVHNLPNNRDHRAAARIPTTSMGNDLTVVSVLLFGER